MSNSPLYEAVRLQDLQEVKRLLNRGDDPNVANATDWTPLLLCAYNGYSRIADELLMGGARIDICFPNSGWSPLYLAAQNNHVDILHTLCLHGANVNKRCNAGFSPLHAASRSNGCAAIESLFAFGADLDMLSNIQSTPIMAAVYLEQTDAVRTFLRLGADTGKQSIHYYRVDQTQNVAIQQLLKKHKIDEKEIASTRASIKRKVFSQVFRRYHVEILDICIALAESNLPPYVLLWIVDWLPNYKFVSHHKKIHLIESICASVRKFRERKEVCRRFGLRERKCKK